MTDRPELGQDEAYVGPPADELAEVACPFCNYAGPSPIIAEIHDVIIFEPLNPVTPGHVIVVPKRHVPNFTASAAESVAVIGAALRYINEVGIESYNLITSAGAPATQTVFHLHLHVVPRRFGDGLALPWTGQ